MTRIAAYVPDLMDRSRLAAVPGITFVAKPADLVEATAEVVVVDLSRAGVLEAVAELAGQSEEGGRRLRTVGFGSHVDEELLAAARAAGCDEVLPRSRFFAHLPALLER